jgi:hypothetical protein
MKKLITQAIKTTTCLLAFAGTSMAQNVPIDYETTGNGANWTWTVFENLGNPAVEIIANPDMSGINTSCTVAKFTALQGGQPWAGCESMHGSDLGSFTLSAANSTINIMVWKTVISDVGIKLVTPTNAALPELKIANTLTNQWELITFDFSAYIGQGPYVGEMVDQVVIFPDFGARNQENIIYFDNVWGAAAITTACGSAASIDESSKISLNLFPNPTNDKFNIQSDFSIEQVTIYTLTGFEIMSETTDAKSVTMDISNFVNGVYILEAKINGETIKRRIVKN